MIGPHDHRPQDSRGEVGASAVVATGLVARISCAPSAQTTACALQAWRYSCASKRPTGALSELVRLLCLSESGARDRDI